MVVSRGKASRRDWLWRPEVGQERVGDGGKEKLMSLLSNLYVS
jgi:hypothetical protein